LALCTPPAAAHNLPYAAAQAEIFEDGSFEITLHCHVAAFLLGETQGHLSAEARERWSRFSDADLARLSHEGARFLKDAVEIYADGKPVEIETVSLPDLAALRADGLVPQEDARPSAPMTLRGKLGARAGSFAFVAPPGFSQTLLSIADWRGSRVVEVLGEGGRSHPFLLQPGARRGEVLVAVPSWLVSFAEYGALGFEHIVPLGADHMLFVLSLFLLAQRWRPLLLQVTAFTVAHSITLALATFDLVTAPAIIVEPLIAATIVAVAIDNLRTQTLHTWRVGVVFAFGLLHGLGFAGALKRLGLPPGDEAIALVSFNLGVEAGQIAVIAAAFLLVGWARNRPWFRPRVVAPASLAIAGVGAWWLIERIWANL
jgi:hypothetical protein